MSEYSIIEILTNDQLTTEARAEVMSVAWPGLYPLYYLCKDGGVLCPKCVNKNIKLIVDATVEGGDDQWEVVARHVNYENRQLTCDNCDDEIPAAYGDGEETSNDSV